MCWAACDRLARIATKLCLEDRVAHWRKYADTIRERVLAESWNEERGYFADAYGGERLDASLLLLADLGFIEARDPRFVATVEAIGKPLKRGNGLFRYIAPVDSAPPETNSTLPPFRHHLALAPHPP